MNNSLWTASAVMPDFPALDADLNTDILIVGGGLAGLLCCRLLTDAGAKAVLIEADKLCRGVSANTTAKITAQHGLIYSKLLQRFGADAARSYWQINTGAIAGLRSLAQGIDCDLETKDNYIFGEGCAGSLLKELSALKELGIPGEYVPTNKLPFPTAGAIRFREQAQFHPLKFAAGIARDLKIFENTPALEFQKNTVVTKGGKIRANRIIIATHFPILNKHGGYFMKLYQQRSYVLALKNGPDVDGMYLSAGENGISLRNYGDLLLLGGGGHRTGKHGGGWEALEDFAKRYLPGTKEQFRWATQDCITLDAMPYIGRYSPGTPNMYVATGFNKWGMTGTMVSAQILTDMLQGIRHPGAELFSPARKMALLPLAQNAGESTLNLLRPAVPRCPHLGCALRWNPREHSWDCPCHGSRFDEDGKLVDNPATGDLKDK